MDFLQDSGFSTTPPVEDHLSKLLEVTPDGGGGGCSSIFSEELIFDLGDLDDGDDNLEDKMIIKNDMDTIGDDGTDSYPWMLQGSTSSPYSDTNHFEFERNPFEGSHYNHDRTDHLHEGREQKSPIFNVNKTDQNQSWWFENDNFSESPILTNMGSNLLLSSTSLKSFDDDEDLEMQNGQDFDFPEDFDLEYYDQLLLQGSLPSSLGSGSSSLDSVMANFGSLNLYDDHRSTEEPIKVRVSGQPESLLVRNKPKQVKKRHFPNTSEEYRHKKMLLKMRKYQRERLAKMSVAEQERYRGRSRAYYWEKMQKWEPEKFREAILKRKGQLQQREQSLLLPKQ